MSKKGFLKIQFLSIQGLKCKEQSCVITATAVDTTISAKLQENKIDGLQQYFLPITEKISIEAQSSLPSLGFFELPIKKIYDHPTKKHLITINLVTKHPDNNELNPEVYAVLKVALMYFENHIAKLDILIDRLHLTEEKAEAERELYVECMVGNVSSQTTLKKGNEGGFEWKEMLPFTLQSIPGKIEISIKDKDMSNEQSLGKITLDPQRERFFEADTNKQQLKYDLEAQDRKFSLQLSKLFKIPQNQ